VGGWQPRERGYAIKPSAGRRAAKEAFILRAQHGGKIAGL
jgi:hypothetical protein